MENLLDINTSTPWFYGEDVLTSAKIFLGFDTILTALTITANGIFLVTLIRKASLHTPPNILLGALCISDLLIGLVLQPLWIAHFFQKIERSHSFRLFSIKTFLMFVFIGLSFKYMALISFERYIAICHPFKYIQHATKRLAITVPGLVLFFWAVITAVSFFIEMDEMLEMLYIISTAFSTSCLITIIFCNWRIFKVIKRQKRQITALRNQARTQNHDLINSERERKQTNVIAILVAVFLICYLPTFVKYHLMSIAGQVKDDSLRLIFNMWTDFLLFSNSLANPLLYCFRLKSIRRAMIETFVDLKRLILRV